MKDDFYKSIIQHAPVGYAYIKIFFDDNGSPADYEFIDVNHAFEALAGMPGAELIGRRISDVLPGMSAAYQKWIQIYGEVTLNEGERCIEQYSDKMNKWYKIQIYSPEKGYIITHFVDITAEKSYLTDLDNFFEVNIDLFIISDMQGNTIKRNKAWETVLGYSKEELQDASFSDFVHPDDLAITNESRNKCCSEGGTTIFINRVRHKNGSYRYFEWRLHQGNNVVYTAAQDITERRQMEEELKQKKEQYELAIRGSNDGIWDWNLLTGEAYLSPKWKEQLGYDDNELKAGTEGFLALVHPDEIKMVTEQIQLYLQGKLDRYDIIIRMKHKDGAYRWIRTRGEALRDAEGKAYRMAGSHTDITVQKMAEETLYKSEQNFRTFFETIDDLIFIADVTGKIFYSNSAVTRKLGYTREELDGMHVLDVHPEDRRAEAERIFADMFAGVRDYCPLPLMKKDGSRTPVETRVWFGTWDGKDCIFGISKDLSVQQAAYDRFHKLFDNNPALMAVSSINSGKFIDVNEAFIEKMGYSREELLGKSSEELGLFADYDQRKLIGIKLQQEGRIRNVEMKIRKKDGEIRIGLFSGEIVDNQIDKAFLTVMTDITEQKNAEAKLILAKELAESANTMKSQFLANMSHEIRTPMNGILGYLDLLQRSNLSAEQKVYAQEAKSASEILLYLINDILDFSKIEAGKVNLEKTKMKLRTVIENAVSIHMPKAKEKNIDLRTFIRPEVPDEVMGDPTRIRQILNNLMGNAIKFTKKGGISVSVSSRNAGEGRAMIFFEVKDTGIGMSGEDMNKLFKPFSQADSSTTREFGGTGLGLAISKQLASMMGGEISVESTPELGSTFVFSLCVDVIKEAPPHVASKINISGINVLVAAEMAGCRNTIRRCLVDTGCNIIEADNGGKALADILMGIETKNSIRLAIVDHDLPDMNGLQLANTLRQIPSASDVKLILLAATEEMADDPKLKTYGFSGCITKPAKPNVLLRCIAGAIGLTTPQNEPAAASGEAGQTEQTEQPGQSERLQKMEKTESSQPQILLVEDNEMNRKLILLILQQHNLTCDIAVDGADAVKALEMHRYDMVFMDCQMPVMDGYQSTTKIRQMEGKQRHTPIIAMTANAMEGDRQKCLDAGMDDYISKPLDFDVMLQLIEKYANKK